MARVLFPCPTSLSSIVQLFASLQFFSLSLWIAFAEAVSGIILISAFLPLDSLALSWLELPSLFSWSLVLIRSPLSFFSSIISALIFLIVVPLFGMSISSLFCILSLILDMTSFWSCVLWAVTVCCLLFVVFSATTRLRSSIVDRRNIIIFFIRLIRLCLIKRLWFGFLFFSY